jgi:hypothetical protein
VFLPNTGVVKFRERCPWDSANTANVGARDYWRAQFKREDREERKKSDEKKNEPRRLAGLGDEAFWVGDAVTGALYVLRGEVFLRVSVGGPLAQAEKIKRAEALARYALKRLDTSGRTNLSR